MKILGTGLNGLVGSRVVELLQNKYEFENLSRSTGCDITDKNQITEKVSSSDAKIVLHCAAKTNVDACESEKNLGENSEAWQVNVKATENIAAACKATGKKLIYISTDFVFSGNDVPEKGYTETDVPDPINFYGLTKYEGEKQIHESGATSLIARIAYPYRGTFSKNDFMRAIENHLKNNQAVQMVTDHIFTPTFIDDIAAGIDSLIESNQTGIAHLVGKSFLTPYDAAKLIAETFGYQNPHIEKTTREKYFQGKAKRGFQLMINSDKIKALGIQMKTFEEGLRSIKKQLENY